MSVIQWELKCTLVFAFFASIALPISGFEKDLMRTIFDTDRLFQDAPQEGISLVSNSAQDAYLIDGETDDVFFLYVFMPPAGTSPDQYEMAFACDPLSVYDLEQCSINNAEAQILDTDATAYNTTVVCSFSRFPGTASCELSASLRAGSTRTISASLDAQNLSLPGTSSATIRQTSSDVFTSPRTTVNVYGIVLFSPDSAGEASEDATIYSGILNTYQLERFDRISERVREFLISANVPGTGSVSGSSAVDLFQTATTTTTVEDYILRYDSNACMLTDAQVLNGKISLLNPDSCGVGITSVAGVPTFGFQIRPYKSGKFILKMIWNSFGTSQEAYEQTMSFKITETAPPVLVSIQKDDIYTSIPCERQTISIVAYNVRFADSRAVSVSNEDGTTSAWSELTESFSYDSSTDQSSLEFESAGGSGSNIPFTLSAVFGSETRSGVVLDSNLDAFLSFSTPPVLNSIDPDISSIEGGDLLVLKGTFENFGPDVVVFVGGYVVPEENVTVESSTQITFAAPALSSLGSSFMYNVSVGVCAEQSAPVKLSYIVSPSLSITSIDSGIDETGSFIIPRNGSASFIAEVAGNNVGIEYKWSVLTSDGETVVAGVMNTKSQVFSLDSTILKSSSESYTLVCDVQNSLDLLDTANITVKLSGEGTALLSVIVYDIEDLSRSGDTVTLVQSSVQFVEDPDNLVNLADYTMILEWTYNEQAFKYHNSTADKETTGPTQFGLEFNIARRDLIIGENILQLTAYIAENPDIRGTNEVKVRVVPSELQPVINDGVNGTLILEGNDLILSSGNSLDPDVLEGEGDSTSGLEYEWISCRKALTPTFSLGAENCASILPSDPSSMNITVSAESLSASRLDESMEGDPTYFSFGLLVKKGNRSAEAFSYFELRTVDTPEPVPQLSSLHVVDVKGVPLQDLSVFSDIIIQPASADAAVQWTFDMALPSQRYLFSMNGVLKSGSGFVTSNRVQSRKLLGFRAGALKPSTEYKVRVTTSAPDTSLESEYEVSFRTDDNPTLTCIPPEVTTGTVSDSKFVISAQLSFEGQSIEYCFYLRTSPLQKYSVGKGCSSVPFAEFSFPMAGTFGIECIARTVTGAIIDAVTLDTNLVLSTPTPEPESTTIGIITNRLNTISTTVDECEALKDHACIELFFASAPSFLNEVEQALQENSSEEALTLLDSAREYMARLSALSEILAAKTVYRPNQIEESIDQTFFLSQISTAFVENESTLFAFLAPVENAVNSTQGEFSQPLISNEVVEKVSGTANLTLTTALSISQEGTSRRRLRHNADGAHQSFAVVLHTVTRLVGSIRAQQETCGYSGSESTSYPISMGMRSRATVSDGFEIGPLEIGIKVSCTRAQVKGGLQHSKVALELCEAVLGVSEIRRLVVVMVPIPDYFIDITGFETRIDSYIDELAYLETQGFNLSSLPEQCLRVILKRKQSTLSVGGFENLVGGRLRNVPSITSNCTDEDCYLFDKMDDVAFGENEVVIQTNQEGLFTAGNLTGRIANLQSDSLEGAGLGLGGQVIRAIGAGIAFIVGAVLVTWLASSNFCVVSAPQSSSGLGIIQPPIDSQWVYIERDLFGRESLLKDGSHSSQSGVHMTIPEGAQPPETGPDAKS